MSRHINIIIIFALKRLHFAFQITQEIHLSPNSPAHPNPTTVTRLNVSLPKAARKSKYLKILCKYLPVPLVMRMVS